MLKSPDWEYWGRMRDVTLRDALLLSLNLCPNTYNHETTSIKAQKFAQRYLDNFQIVKSHIYCSDWLVGRVSKKEFDLNVTFTGSTCALGNGGTAKGVLYYDAAIKQILAMGMNTGKTDGFIAFGVKP